jgi:Flp pilus assembly protein TadG
MTFALALVPIMGAVGAAVDYSRASNIRTQLHAAADAAAVGAVAKSSPAMAAAATMTQDGPIAAGETDALKIFNSQVTGKSSLYSNLSVTAVVKKTSANVTSTVQFTANVPTLILGVFSKGTISISGESKAANGLSAYIDFYLLLDNTPSMGVAATPADINTMVNNTPDQCAFACHDLADPNNYYNKAKKLGVQLRIDVVRQATQKLMDAATASTTVSGQFRAAIYTFGSSARNPGLTRIQSLTSNLSKAKSAAAAIDLMTVPYHNYASDTDTDFGDILTSMNKAITTPGSGTASTSPQKYLFFVSDGLADRALGSPKCSQPTSIQIDPQTGKTYTRCQEPLDPSFCTTMKNRGVKIAVLYTTYLPLPTSEWYNTWIAPFASKIATNMEKCASPGLYFEVSPSQGIFEAMHALFQKSVAQARLTQ